jgi:hypothetical protein
MNGGGSARSSPAHSPMSSVLTLEDLHSQGRGYGADFASSSSGAAGNRNRYYYPSGGSPRSSQDQDGDGDQDTEGEADSPQLSHSAAHPSYPSTSTSAPISAQDSDAEEPSDAEEGSNSEYVDNDTSDSDGEFLPAGVARRRRTSASHSRRYAPYASSGTSSGSAGAGGYEGYGYATEGESFLFKEGEEEGLTRRVFRFLPPERLLPA